MIIKSGYAKHRRPGSTREYRRQRELILSNSLACFICGEGQRSDDPWEAHHVEAYADSGSHAGMKKAHRSCNRRVGRT